MGKAPRGEKKKRETDGPTREEWGGSDDAGDPRRSHTGRGSLGACASVERVHACGGGVG